MFLAVDPTEDPVEEDTDDVVEPGIFIGATVDAGVLADG